MKTSGENHLSILCLTYTPLIFSCQALMILISVLETALLVPQWPLGSLVDSWYADAMDYDPPAETFFSLAHFSFSFLLKHLDQLQMGSFLLCTAVSWLWTHPILCAVASNLSSFSYLPGISDWALFRFLSGFIFRLWISLLNIPVWKSRPLKVP